MTIFNTSIFKLLIVLYFSSGIFAQSGAAHFFEQGNQAYRNNEFEAAITWYNKILDAGYEDSQVYYNMGNCFFKLDQIGPAILYYEKARKLNPHDKETLFNLQLANTKIVDRIELPPKFFMFEWWDALKYNFTVAELTVIVALFYIASVLLLGLIFILRIIRFRRSLLTIASVIGFITLLSAYLLFSNIQENNNHREAILMASSINVQSAPDPSSTDVFVLHEGVKLLLTEQRNEWVKITLPDGKSGWVQKNNLEVI